MLFTSYAFVLVFLPATIVAVYIAGALNARTAAKVLLLSASFVFYAFWNPRYVALLFALLAFNYVLGKWLLRVDPQARRRRTTMLVVGLVANIGVLFYFKYTNFAVAEISSAFGLHWAIPSIILPLGISFIVFQKIAFLVDAYNGRIKHLDPLDYALFVSFFPQLISGPIVHHNDVFPQFESDQSLRYRARLVPIAISFLVIGAFKKVVIADHLSSQVGAAYQMTAHGHAQDLFGSWIAATAYTLQIYFDFSGYSDMAIGLGLLFGVRLPYNFNSPLKAHNIIEFWSRWHITLTRFLTAYIYNPIVTRLTRARIRARKRITVDGKMLLGAFLVLLAIPTMITFLIAGAWHGAGFQFIVFGGLHGIYLVVTHGWRSLRRSNPDAGEAPVWQRALARITTFMALVVAAVFFRADSARTGMRFIASMCGAHGLRPRMLTGHPSFLALMLTCLFIAQVLPNAQELLGTQLDALCPPLDKHPGEVDATMSTYTWPKLTWRPSLLWAIGIAIAGWVVILMMAAPTEFLYFQF